MFQERKYPRISEKWNLDYHLVAREDVETGPISTVAQNISGGGICFRASESLKPKAMVALEMTSPSIPSPILALARVVWAKPCAEGGGYEIGAEFWWVGWKDNSAQATMADYIKAKTEAEKRSEKKDSDA